MKTKALSRHHIRRGWNIPSGPKSKPPARILIYSSCIYPGQ